MDNNSSNNNNSSSNNNNSSSNNNNKNNNNNNNNNKRIKIDNNKSFSNIIIIKILNYAIKDLIKMDKHYSFMGTLSLVCKSWSLFVLPKLDIDETIFKNDDYLYTYLKVRDSIRSLNNSKRKTTFKICNDNQDINAALSLLYCPSITTGKYRISSVEPNYGYHLPNSQLDFNIYIDNQECGTIFHPDIVKIESFSKPSSFGQADKTVFDTSIRKGFHIEGSRVNVPYFNYTDQYAHSPLYHLTNRQYLKNSSEFDVKLYKIHIYKEGGHFEQHIDTISSMNHVGTYIVPLGVSTYSGGEFVISENESFDETTIEYKIEAKASSTQQNIYNFKWIAFYNDCIHKVKPVTNGTRIVLQFNINIKEKYNKNIYYGRDVSVSNDLPHMSEGSEINYNEPIKYSKKNQFLTLNLPDDRVVEIMKSNEKYLNRVSAGLDRVMKDREVNTGLFLVHLYKAHVNENNLKGIDKIIWDHLKQVYGEDRVKIRTFIITTTHNYDYDNENEDNQEIIKIGILTSKTINQQSSLLNYEDKDTLMFCGKKYSNLYSIYSKPLPSTGNEERYSQDLGAFSAILISNNNNNNNNNNNIQ